jgi:hypothetical protein
MADFSTVLPVLAALLHLSGFTLYNIQAKLGKSKPNPASWFLWAFLATLNALSFSAMNDPIAALQFFAGSVGCIVTFLYVLMIGRLKWPTMREWVTLVIGLIAIFVWREFTATAANMILAGVLLWSFEPTLHGVWCDPSKEKPLAWYLWASAFAITGVNTYLFKGGWTLSMVIPIVGFVCHLAVPAICTEGRKRMTAVQGL